MGNREPSDEALRAALRAVLGALPPERREALLKSLTKQASEGKKGTSSGG